MLTFCKLIKLNGKSISTSPVGTWGGGGGGGGITYLDKKLCK